MPLDATPLRILLASARPLILKIERWEAELSDMATRHIAAAATALQTVADIGRFQADGRTIRFELYPPRPGAEVIRRALATDGEHPIPARAVELFARAFYADLARGRHVQRAFDDGLEAVRGDDMVGERRLPDGADSGMPTPWRRFRLYGDATLAWQSNPVGESRVILLVEATPHRRLPRTDELFVGRHLEVAATVEALEPPRPGIEEHKPRIVTLHGEGGWGRPGWLAPSRSGSPSVGGFPMASWKSTASRPAPPSNW